jgi:nucleotide-binding universal stress UspA family protein
MLSSAVDLSVTAQANLGRDDEVLLSAPRIRAMSTASQSSASVRFQSAWITPSITIGAASIAVLLSKGWNHEWAVSAVLWFSLSAVAPALVALALRDVAALRRSIADISTNVLDIPVQPLPLAACGFAALGVALATRLSVDIFPFIGWARTAAFLVACAFFLSYGALAYIFGVTFLLAVRLGNARIQSDVLSWPNERIASIHAVYVRLLLVGGTSYLAGVAVVRFAPRYGSWHALNDPWNRFWVLPPAFAAIAFFVVFSVALHKVLRQCRNRSERAIDEHLQQSYALWKTSHDPASASAISELLKWRESVRAEKLWPMDFKALFQAAPWTGVLRRTDERPGNLCRHQKNLRAGRRCLSTSHLRRLDMTDANAKGAVQRIVVGVDFSETGDNALRQAMQLAQRFESSELHVTYVLNNPSRSLQLDDLDEALSASIEQLRGLVDRVCAPEPGASALTQDVVFHVRVGTPAAAIHQVAIDIDADMLVVGTHARRGVEKFLLGSVAEELVRIARLPLLIAHPKSMRDLARSDRPEPARPGEDLHGTLTRRARLELTARSTHISGLL